MFSQHVLAEDIPIVVAEKRATDKTRPHRAPGINPLNCSFDDINFLVEVTFTSGIEDATVRLTNLTTGEITTTYGNTQVVNSEYQHYYKNFRMVTYGAFNN